MFLYFTSQFKTLAEIIMTEEVQMINTLLQSISKMRRGEKMWKHLEQCSSKNFCMILTHLNNLYYGNDFISICLWIYLLYYIPQPSSNTSPLHILFSLPLCSLTILRSPDTSSLSSYAFYNHAFRLQQKIHPPPMLLPQLLFRHAAALVRSFEIKWILLFFYCFCLCSLVVDNDL